MPTLVDSLSYADCVRMNLVTLRNFLEITLLKIDVLKISILFLREKAWEETQNVFGIHPAGIIMIGRLLRL